MTTEQNGQGNSPRRSHRRPIVPRPLELAVLPAIVLGPYGPLSCVAGLFNSGVLWELFSLCTFVFWVMLFGAACVRSARQVRVGRGKEAALWLGVAVGIVLAHVLWKTDQTPSVRACFGHGLLAHVEIRTDVDAIRAWVTSLDPNDCRPVPHHDSRGRPLSENEQPEVLKRQDGSVRLELDTDGRPCVRLMWYHGGKTGIWGLVIGRRDMETPPSGPGMYDEQNSVLRRGVYFWYEES